MIKEGITQNSKAYNKSLAIGKKSNVLVGFEFEVYYNNEVSDNSIDAIKTILYNIELEDIDDYFESPEHDSIYDFVNSKIENNYNILNKTLLGKLLYAFELKSEKELCNFIYISDLTILDHLGYDNSGYKNAANSAKTKLEKIFGKQIDIFDQAKQTEKSLSNWTIEPDGSLKSEYDGYVPLEIVTNPMPVSEAITVLKQFFDFAKRNCITDDTTGLHINVSIPGGVDTLKLAAIFGDSHVLKMFDRYTDERDDTKPFQMSSSVDIAKKDIQLKFGKYYPEDLNSMLKTHMNDHYSSICSEKNDYISFRHVGGEYTSMYKSVLDVFKRCIHSIVIAADPSKFKNEYLKKIAKTKNMYSAGDTIFVEYSSHQFPHQLFDIVVQYDECPTDILTEITGDCTIVGIRSLPDNKIPRTYKTKDNGGFAMKIDASLAEELNYMKQR